MVYAEITLKNSNDVMQCRKGAIEEQEIRQVTVKALVDTGAMSMIINEELRVALGLGIVKETVAALANGKRERVNVAEPVDIHWKDRDTTCGPVVISGDGKILLGAIPLEGMDLIVDPARQELIGANGDEPVFFI